MTKDADKNEEPNNSPVCRAFVCRISGKPIHHSVVGSFVFLLTFVTLSVAGLLSYNSSQELIRRGVEMDLTAMAAFAASKVDGDMHDALRKIEGQNPNSLKFQTDRLNEVLKRFPELKYVYTVYRDGKDIKFLLDPTPPGDADGDGVDEKSYPGDVYDDYSPVLAKAIFQGRSFTEMEPYSDTWGTTISAYSPFFKEDGSVAGVAGVDLSYDRYVQRFADAQWGFILWCFLSISLSALLGWMTSSSIRATRESIRKIMLTHNVVETRNKELAELNTQLDRQARYDELTGHFNRSAFDQVCRAAINEYDLGNLTDIAIAFIDLDNFKMINDSYGHDHGDDLLRVFANRLSSFVPEAEIGRFGGDEFLVLCTHPSAEHNLTERMTQLISSLQDPLEVRGFSHTCTISVGIASVKEKQTSTIDLIRMADIAMYRAKSIGKNGLVVFQDEMSVSIVQRMSLESELRNGWANGELWVAIQPIVNLKEQRVTGGELLMRWTKADGVVVPPSLFIPITEETGLILELGYWMIERACFKLQGWAFDPAKSQATIAVNVSGRQLADEDFIAKVFNIVESLSFDPSRLILEVTESMLIDDIDTINEKLRILRERGIQIALDDFGTGYSSLSMLSRMPIDYLKIDQSFVMGMTKCERTMRLTKSILTLAKGLGLKVVGEGIEGFEHSDILLGLGCDFGQGYAYSKPVPLDEFHLLIDGENSINRAA